MQGLGNTSLHIEPPWTVILYSVRRVQRCFFGINTYIQNEITFVQKQQRYLLLQMGAVWVL